MINKIEYYKLYKHRKKSPYNNVDSGYYLFKTLSDEYIDIYGKKLYSTINESELENLTEIDINNINNFEHKNSMSFLINSINGPFYDNNIEKNIYMILVRYRQSDMTTNYINKGLMLIPAFKYIGEENDWCIYSNRFNDWRPILNLFQNVTVLGWYYTNFWISNPKMGKCL